MLEGMGDTKAIAIGALEFPLVALGRRNETVVLDAFTGKPVAWFPVGLNHITTNPTGRTWAGAEHSHVYIITLEESGPPSPA